VDQALHVFSKLLWALLAVGVAGGPGWFR